MNYEPPATPIWLTDQSYPAPCPCGRPLNIGEPIALIESEGGFKTMVHASCLSQLMVEDDGEGS